MDGINELAMGRVWENREAEHPRKGDLNWDALERLDWHLWGLAIVLIFVLGVSLLSFMFPSVFWLGRSSPADTSQRAFFGFCTLLGLSVIYLLQRQSTVRRLKRQVYEA